MLSTRAYQDRALEAIDAAEFRGLQRLIVAMATGTGKTVVFSHLLKRRGGRSVVLAHRDELVQQAAEKLRMVNPGARVGIVKAAQDDVNADIVVASVQTLARPARLRTLMRRDGQASLFGDPAAVFRTVVVDEVHHYIAGEDGNTFGQVLEGLGCMATAGPLTVGFTATPERSDGSALGATWQEIVYELGILDGMRQGFLAPLRAKQIKLMGADFSKLHVRAGEFRDEESADMLMAADAPGHAARAYVEHAFDRKAIVFTPTVAVAKAMAAAFRGLGVRAESVDGEMPMDERRAVLRRLATGETMVVPNAQVLTEGFDEPSVSCVIMARPTRSRPFAIQCIGRGTRLYPGKKDCLILDLVGSSVRMDLVTVATLFDVPEEATERGVLEAVEAKKAAGPAEAEPEGGQLVAVDVDLFQKRDFAWVQTETGGFVLSLGAEGNLVLVPGVEPGRMDIYQVKRLKFQAEGEKWPRYTEERKKLYAGLDLGYAMGAAEDLVRKSHAAVLNRRDAPWRRGDPTEAQIKALTRRKRYRPGMSRGEASDALTALYAGAGARRRA